MGRRVWIDLGDFAQEAAEAEARRQGVTLEELLEHAVLYYLADLDAGRIAARVFPRREGRRAS